MSTREVDHRGDVSRRVHFAPSPAFVEGGEESEDKVLTIAFKRGEKGAYQAIHDRYAQRVHGVCRRMLLHPEDAEEAAQESFLRVYQALGRFNGRYLLGPWITRVTTNVCLDHLRARGRRPVDLVPVEVLEFNANGDVELDPQEIHVRRAEGRRVHKLLESLPPLYRAAIVLRDFEGLSYAEVAAALEITEPQTKALIHRARQAFKRSWSSALLALPLRFVNRVRRIDPSARDQGTASVQHTSDLVGSAVHAASSCSAVVQQCGQYLADKIAPLATAGAIVIGAGAATASPPADPAPLQRIQSVDTAQTLDVASPTFGASRAVTTSVRAPKQTKADGAPSDAPVEDPPPPVTPAEPTPAPEEPVEPPAPEPTETAPPENTGGSGGNGTPAPSESPSPSPSPLPPSGFRFSFDVSQPGATNACSCMGSTKVQSSNVGSTSAGIERLDQVLTGTASRAGTPTYGLWVDHQSPSGTGHHMDFRLYTNEGGYFYSATGTLVDRTLMDWSGWQYTYRGTYKLGSRPGGGEQMTTSGSYTLVVQASWAENRVVSTAFTLTSGS